MSYVTVVREGGQQPCNFKDEGYKWTGEQANQIVEYNFQISMEENPGSVVFVYCMASAHAGGIAKRATVAAVFAYRLLPVRRGDSQRTAVGNCF